MHRGWTFRAERIAVDKRTCKLERSGNRKVSKSPRFTVLAFIDLKKMYSAHHNKLVSNESFVQYLLVKLYVTQTWF